MGVQRLRARLQARLGGGGVDDAAKLVGRRAQRIALRAAQGRCNPKEDALRAHVLPAGVINPRLPPQPPQDIRQNRPAMRVGVRTVAPHLVAEIG